MTLATHEPDVEAMTRGVQAILQAIHGVVGLDVDLPPPEDITTQLHRHLELDRPQSGGDDSIMESAFADDLMEGGFTGVIHDSLGREYHYVDGKRIKWHQDAQPRHLAAADAEATRRAAGPPAVAGRASAAQERVYRTEPREKWGRNDAARLEPSLTAGSMSDCIENARKEYIAQQEAGRSPVYVTGIVCGYKKGVKHDRGQYADAEGFNHAWVQVGDAIIDPSLSVKRLGSKAVAAKDAWETVVYIPKGVKDDHDVKTAGYQFGDDVGWSDGALVPATDRMRESADFLEALPTLWVPYVGPKGGRGWRNTQTQLIHYGPEPPGHGQAHNATEPVVVPPSQGGTGEAAVKHYKDVALHVLNKVAGDHDLDDKDIGDMHHSVVMLDNAEATTWLKKLGLPAAPAGKAPQDTLRKGVFDKYKAQKEEAEAAKTLLAPDEKTGVVTINDLKDKLKPNPLGFHGTKAIGPVTVEGYRVGVLDNKKGGVFLAGDAEGAQGYASLHPGHAVEKYHVSLTNPLLAGHQNDVTKALLGKTYIDLHAQYGGGVEGGRKVDAAIAKAAKAAGHDGIIYLKPAAPAKTEVVAFDAGALAKQEGSGKSDDDQPELGDQDELQLAPDVQPAKPAPVLPSQVPDDLSSKLPTNTLGIDVGKWKPTHASAKWAAKKIAQYEALAKAGQWDQLENVKFVSQAAKPNGYQKAVMAAYGKALMLKAKGDPGPQDASKWEKVGAPSSAPVPAQPETKLAAAKKTGDPLVAGYIDTENDEAAEDLYNEFQNAHGGSADSVSHGHGEVAAALATQGHHKMVVRDHSKPGNPVVGAISYGDALQGETADITISHLGSTGDVKGVGTQLVQHVLAAAAKEGVGVSFESTPGAEKFYEKLGFKHLDPKQSKLMGASAEQVKALAANADEPKTGEGAQPELTKVAPAAKPGEAQDDVSTADWQQTGSQKGSNPGGKFKDPKTGKEFYVKFSKSESHAKNETLAAKLYELAGAAVPAYQLVKTPHGLGTASAWQEHSPETFDPENPHHLEAAVENFGVHAWLANWDAVGATNDNQVFVGTGADKKLVTIDTGGSLLYRAQGGKKDFGPEVKELHTLLDPKLNPTAAKVFGAMTPGQKQAALQKVAEVSDAAIEALATKYGPGDNTDKIKLIDTLKKRKAAIAAEAQKIGMALASGNKIESGPAQGGVPASAVSHLSLSDPAQDALQGIQLIDAKGQTLTDIYHQVAAAFANTSATLADKHTIAKALGVADSVVAETPVIAAIAHHLKAQGGAKPAGGEPQAQLPDNAQHALELLQHIDANLGGKYGTQNQVEEAVLNVFLKHQKGLSIADKKAIAGKLGVDTSQWSDFTTMPVGSIASHLTDKLEAMNSGEAKPAAGGIPQKPLVPLEPAAQKMFDAIKDGVQDPSVHGGNIEQFVFDALKHTADKATVMKAFGMTEDQISSIWSSPKTLGEGLGEFLKKKLDAGKPATAAGLPDKPLAPLTEVGQKSFDAIKADVAAHTDGDGDLWGVVSSHLAAKSKEFKVMIAKAFGVSDADIAAKSDGNGYGIGSAIADHLQNLKGGTAKPAEPAGKIMGVPPETWTATAQQAFYTIKAQFNNGEFVNGPFISLVSNAFSGLSYPEKMAVALELGVTDAGITESDSPTAALATHLLAKAKGAAKPGAQPAQPAAPTMAVPVPPHITSKANAGGNKKLQALYAAAQSGDIAKVEAIATNATSQQTYTKMIHGYKMAVLAAMKSGGKTTAKPPTQTVPQPKAQGPKLPDAPPAHWNATGKAVFADIKGALQAGGDPEAVEDKIATALSNFDSTSGLLWMANAYGLSKDDVTDEGEGMDATTVAQALVLKYAATGQPKAQGPKLPDAPPAGWGFTMKNTFEAIKEIIQVIPNSGSQTVVEDMGYEIGKVIKSAGLKPSSQLELAEAFGLDSGNAGEHDGVAEMLAAAFGGQGKPSGPKLPDKVPGAWPDAMKASFNSLKALAASGKPVTKAAVKKAMAGLGIVDSFAMANHLGVDPNKTNELGVHAAIADYISPQTPVSSGDTGLPKGVPATPEALPSAPVVPGKGKGKFDPAKLPKPPEVKSEDASKTAGKKAVVANLYKTAQTGDVKALQAIETYTSQTVASYKQALIDNIKEQINPPASPAPPKTFTGHLDALEHKITSGVKEAQANGLPQVGFYVVVDNPGVPVDVNIPKVVMHKKGQLTLKDPKVQAQHDAALAAMTQKTRDRLKSHKGSPKHEGFWHGTPSASDKAYGLDLLKHAPVLPTGMHLIRMVNLGGDAIKKIRASVGKIYQEPAAAGGSTPVDPTYNTSADVEWNMTAAEGAKGIYIGHKWGYTDEFEMIMPPGMRYWITKVEDKSAGKVRVHAILLPAVEGQCCGD